MAFLGVNIDHVATVRNARGGARPDPVKAALVAEEFGADGITAHLREDRRHIRDEDMRQLKAQIKTRLNMEMANTPEMVAFALNLKPHMVTLVPERREELTTEGGLDVKTHRDALRETIERLHEAKIRVSLFIDPDIRQLQASHEIGARIVELHTGQYAEAFGAKTEVAALKHLHDATLLCNDLNIEVNAGHGLDYNNVKPLLALPCLMEMNIGHSIISESIFTGLGPAVRKMKDLIS